MPNGLPRNASIQLNHFRRRREVDLTPNEGNWATPIGIDDNDDEFRRCVHVSRSVEISFGFRSSGHPEIPVLQK